MARKTENTGLIAIIEVLEVSGALLGERICITGHLSAPRKDIERIIIQAGGTIDKDVNNFTSILVSNSDWTATTIGVDKNGDKKSSKMIKAENNNRFCSPDWPRTKIMNEKEFLQLIINNCKIDNGL